ncbi:MAG TPA: hypothetical protein VGR28_10485 [Candidatus Thermoplasmatota archaeon]|jgi:hypothetical protein|nr:hypothetical protein [Candidatus Thermoplasmatota archaeon]
MTRALLAALVALASLAAAHGGSIILQASQGPYFVQFATYDMVTEGEEVRIVFNVTDNATRERISVQDPRVQVERWDTAGQLRNASVEPLEQPVPGILSGITRIGVQGKTVYRLPLPSATVQFEQPVCKYDDQGIPQCGNPEAKKSPAPPLLAVLCVVALAGLAARRRG